MTVLTIAASSAGLVERLVGAPAYRLWGGFHPSAVITAWDRIDVASILLGSIKLQPSGESVDDHRNSSLIDFSWL
jgi:hypothetical protein